MLSQIFGYKDDKIKNIMSGPNYYEMTFVDSTIHFFLNNNNLNFEIK